MQKAITLRKIIRRFFGKAYDVVEDELFLLALARAFASVLMAQKKKEALTTAYADQSLYKFTESLADMGFISRDFRHAFFGGSPNDILHPFNPLETIDNFEFDVIFGPEHLDICYFSKMIKKALKEIKYSNFLTCLNMQKIMIIAALVCLIPNDSAILEVGSYQCGTTIFIAQLCKELNKNIRVFACDTYEGMPAATAQDKKDVSYYDSGMFLDNPIEKVQGRIKGQNLEKSIRLIKGDVVETLPSLTIRNCSLVFLDTDQYKGTKAGLELVGNLDTFAHVIVDDTGLSSVSLAINEFVKDNTSYSRKNLLTNFDYLIPHAKA